MTSKDKLPEVIIAPQVKEMMDKDPHLAEAMRSLSATFRQALQGVKDGTYKSFDQAIEALTGEKPSKIDPENDDYPLCKCDHKLTEHSVQGGCEFCGCEEYVAHG